MPIDCSAGNPAKWSDVASIGSRVDATYAPYGQASFNSVSGKYVWTFDPWQQDPCNNIEDHFYQTDHSVTEAESVKFSEDALLFVGGNEDGQSNECFCCPIASVSSISPLRFALSDENSSCFTPLDFDNPCNGENSILSAAILNFFATFGNREHRIQSEEEEVDGEMLRMVTFKLCEESTQTLTIGLLWLDEEDMPEGSDFPAGLYGLRRVEIDLNGTLVFKIRSDDMDLLFEQMATRLRQRCSAVDDRWSTMAGAPIPIGCFVSMGALVCTLSEEEEISGTNPGCIECSTTEGATGVLLPWEESTCGGTTCDGRLRLYCETLIQLEKILDAIEGEDLKDDDPDEEDDCIECCLDFGKIELRFEFDHGCDCARFNVYYTKITLDEEGEEVEGEELTYGLIDLNNADNPGLEVDDVTGWKEIVSEGETLKKIRFRFECTNDNLGQCTDFGGSGNNCHDGATGRFRVRGIEAETTITVSTDAEPEVDICELVSGLEDI